jgi:hypothetical protein
MSGTQRYGQLVKEHLHVGDKLASGLRALPDTKSSFASTQAAWCFYQNEATCLRRLSSPLLLEAHAGIERKTANYALIMSDWSRVAYGKHTDTSTSPSASSGYHSAQEKQIPSVFLTNMI